MLFLHHPIMLSCAVLCPIAAAIVLVLCFRGRAVQSWLAVAHHPIAPSVAFERWFGKSLWFLATSVSMLYSLFCTGTRRRPCLLAPSVPMWFRRSYFPRVPFTCIFSLLSLVSARLRSRRLSLCFISITALHPLPSVVLAVPVPRSCFFFGMVLRCLGFLSFVVNFLQVGIRS